MKRGMVKELGSWSFKKRETCFEIKTAQLDFPLQMVIVPSSLLKEQPGVGSATMDFLFLLVPSANKEGKRLHCVHTAPSMTNCDTSSFILHLFL